MHKRFEPKVLPPTEGITYLLDETFLMNLKHGRPPEGKPVEYYLFVERIIRKQRRRFVHTIQEATVEAANNRLAEFAERNDVTIVEEKSRKTLEKTWLIETDESLALPCS